MSKLGFECHALGFPCEWALRSDSARDVVDRVREHARCAHNLAELPPDVLAKVEGAIPPA